MRKDQIIFLRDDNGTEYGTLDHNPSEKNHKNESNRVGEHDQRIYGSGKANCPLHSLKIYLHKLHPKCKDLFQKPKTSNYTENGIWYSNSPLGKNTIGKLMSVISRKACLGFIYTNHCIRATAITTLRDAGVAPTDIINVTGHRSVQSIQHYSKPSGQLRKMMSNTLSRVCEVNKVNKDSSGENLCSLKPIDQSMRRIASTTSKSTPPLHCDSDLNVVSGEGNAIHSQSLSIRTMDVQDQRNPIHMNPNMAESFVKGQAFHNCHFSFHFHESEKKE